MEKGKKKTERTGRTREAVLNAACAVFARHPYNAASIRMIAREGGFGHAVIGYYYPSKALLFTAVAERLGDMLTESSLDWLAEVRPMETEPGFSRYVARVIEFSRQNPWVLRVMMLNISGENVADIPAKERIIEAVEHIRQAFALTMRLSAPDEEIGRFTDSFNAMALYYLGAPHSAAWLVRMDPDSDAYYQWVHTTLVSLFLPMLLRLFGR